MDVDPKIRSVRIEPEFRPLVNASVSKVHEGYRPQLPFFHEVNPKNVVPVGIVLLAQGEKDLVEQI